MKMMILIGNCGLKVNETFIKVVRGVINRVNQEYVATSLSRDSHQVSLWGLRGYIYEDSYPHLSVGANNE